MKKPVIRRKPVRLTVVAPDARKQHDTNPVDTGAGIEASTARPEPLPSTRATRILAPSVRPRKATASLPLLMLLGHRESCASLRRAGAVASCDCRIKPMEDPAVAVGLAVHCARISLARRVALPVVIIELLARHVEEGDQACIIVAEWLETAGLLTLKPLSRPMKKKGSR